MFGRYVGDKVMVFIIWIYPGPDWTKQPADLFVVNLLKLSYKTTLVGIRYEGRNSNNGSPAITNTFDLNQHRSMKPKCKMESDAKESACPMISLVWGGGQRAGYRIQFHRVYRSNGRQGVGGGATVGPLVYVHQDPVYLW